MLKSSGRASAAVNHTLSGGVADPAPAHADHDGDGDSDSDGEGDDGDPENFINEALTRRADETVNTPLYSGGVLYTRGTGLAFGNGSSASTTPAFNKTPTA